MPRRRLPSDLSGVSRSGPFRSDGQSVSSRHDIVRLTRATRLLLLLFI
eukprot:SAG22_NODE_16_length_32723_cov_26.404825_4_plen_48_part_00